MKKITKLCGLLLLFGMMSHTYAAGIVFSFGSNVTPERQAALEAAANEIEQIFHFRQNIKVSVAFNALECDNFSAVLGFAGPNTAYAQFAGAPQNNVWYVSAQAADMGLASAMDDNVHIAAQFNKNIGSTGCLSGNSWYYGTDHNPAGNQIDFLGTAVHEIMHGLGFLSFTGSNGALSSGRIDNFSTFLDDASTGKNWKVMSDGERAASILNDGNLVWNGAKTTAMASLLSAGVNNGEVQLYAPSSYEGGSSTSHFDTAVHYEDDADEVMEPYDAFPQLSILASAVFCDMGWQLSRDTDNDDINDCDDIDPLDGLQDSDDDGVSDAQDAFPDNDAAAADTDDDGMPDAWLPSNPYGCIPTAPTCNGLTLDNDSDNDGVPDATDNCPLIANPDQKDYNNNNQGDVCDPLPMPGRDGVMTKDKTGSVVAFVGDFDDDGYGDYAVGTPGYDVPAAPPLKTVKDVGKTEIISGKTGDVLFELTGGNTKAALGSAIAGNADINGDGIPDVVIGAPLTNDADNGLNGVGAVYIVYGSDSDNYNNVPPDVIYGTEAKAQFGAAVALSDFDNDGTHADVVVGSPNAVNAEGVKLLKQAGRVQVFSGADLRAPVLLNVYGTTAAAHAGTAVAAGDFDGVVGAEVMVGAPKDDDIDNKLKDAGSVRVYSLSGGKVPDYFTYGSAAGDYLGASIATGGDIDTDGLKDWVVGMPGADAIVSGVKKKNAGGIRVILGSTISFHAELDPLPGTDTNGSLGTSVAVGDVNNDGFAEIIVGAPRAANPTAVPKAISATGSVRIYSMSGGSLQVLGTPLYGAKKGDLYGASVSAGDIDGNGKADIIIGSPGKDVLNTKLQKDAGGVLLFSATTF